MEQGALSPLAAWESFYVIIGSSAAALTGLQFVVVVLAADTNSLQPAPTRAFATPTIVHFCAVLLLSAILSAPWHSLSSPAIGLAVAGFVGFIYGLLVIRHARRQTHYKAVLEDWLWHCVFPLIAYSTIFTDAFFVTYHPVSSLFVIAAAAIFLLFIGIHNAWDSVTYIALNRGQPGH
jgi:hypothetical protein